jgi:hypothetical protein
VTEQDFLADVLPNDEITVDDDMSWLEVSTTVLEQRADIMRDGGQNGVDRVWWTDGEYVWFRRSKSNPETLKRHNEFCRTGDYKHVETQGDVEIYQLQPKSPFAVKKSVDIGQMDTYNVRRQAVKAACRRDWKAFRDVMTFLRERINATYVSPNKPGVTPLADNIFAEQYIAVLTAIEMRHGPSPDEINRELMNLAGGPKRMNQSKIISIGGNA